MQQRPIESLKTVEKALDEPAKNCLAKVAKQVDSFKEHLTTTQKQLTNMKHPVAQEDQQVTERMMNFYLPVLWKQIDSLCKRMEKQTHKHLVRPEKTFIQTCEEYQSRIADIKKSVVSLNQKKINDWYLEECLKKVNAKIGTLEKELIQANKGYYEGTITAEDQEVTNAWAKFVLHGLPGQIQALSESIVRAQQKSLPPSPKSSVTD